mgnify:CR=1|jgi:hypothetical protein
MKNKKQLEEMGVHSERDLYSAGVTFSCIAIGFVLVICAIIFG